MGKLRNNKTKEEARRIILRGTLELVGEYGLQKFSTRALASKLQMSSANLYHHFQNMEEILVDATIYFFDEVREAALPKEYDGLEDFYIQLETSVVYFFENNKAFTRGYVIISGSYGNDEGYQKKLLQKYQQNIESTEVIIRKMLPANISEEDAEDFILGLVLLREGIHQLVVADTLKDSYLRIWRRMVKMMIKEIVEKY